MIDKLENSVEILDPKFYPEQKIVSLHDILFIKDKINEIITVVNRLEKRIFEPTKVEFGPCPDCLWETGKACPKHQTKP